jgi:hypothetical protein
LKKTTTIFLALVTGALIFDATPSSAQSVQCEKLPKVEWWSSTHVKVKATVAKNYQGNWNKYIGRWNKYLGRMEKLHDSGSIAVVKSRGLRLKGQQLASHIKDIRARISVLNCLQNVQNEVPAADLEKFETAANGAPPQQFSAPEVQQTITQVATVAGDQLDIEVTAKCDKDSALFQITNLGEKWPRLGEISIYRVNGKSLLSKRRVRMGNSQQATFKIRKRGGGSYGPVGIWVSPSWEKRAFKYDAKISCG